MRARMPDHEGHVDGGGVSIGYQVYGEREPTVLLLTRGGAPSRWPVRPGTRGG